MHQINVIRTFVGGGFDKSDPFPHEMCAAILSRKSGSLLGLLLIEKKFIGLIVEGTQVILK